MTEFGSTDSQPGSWGFYGLFDQVLVPFADRQTNRGLGVFGSVIFSADLGGSGEYEDAVIFGCRLGINFDPKTENCHARLAQSVPRRCVSLI
jgi:hypothetical protein